MKNIVKSYMKLAYKLQVEGSRWSSIEKFVAAAQPEAESII